MSQVALDASLLQQLGGLRERMEVRDERGDVVGVLLPTADYKTLLKYMRIPFTRAEIAAMKAQKGGCTLSEIWEKLRAQYPQHFQAHD